MKAIARTLAILALAATALGASAQQNYKDGAVYRVVKLRILPGKTKDFYKSFSWTPKVLDAEKQAGLIDDWRLYRSVTYEGPDKYDVLLVLKYKNMAALDGLADRAEPIIAKVYGTPENRASVSQQRAESGETVSSELLRDIELLPQP